MSLESVSDSTVDKFRYIDLPGKYGGYVFYNWKAEQVLILQHPNKQGHCLLKKSILRNENNEVVHFLCIRLQEMIQHLLFYKKHKFYNYHK